MTAILTQEIYNKFKHDDRFIHEVTWAHGVQGWDDDNLAMTKYSIAGEDFRVSPELQNTAKIEYERRKREALRNIGDKLVFVGMGLNFVPENHLYVGNHRIRTYFKNNQGVLCFVEFGTGKTNSFMRCDHALMNTRKNVGDWSSLGQRERTEIRLPLERSLIGSELAFTKQNVIDLVNKNFDCDFKEMSVQYYFIGCDDFTCDAHKGEKNLWR